jgi:phage repressor protein C with HTH and peptisase S24 domain
MATDKPRFTITLPDALYDEVTRYKDEKNISTQSKAIQKLVAAAIQALAEEPAEGKGPEPQTSDETAIVQIYRALDGHGKKLVRLILDAETDRVRAQAAQAETPVIDLGTIRRYLSRPAAGPGGMVEGEDYEDIPRTTDMPEGADFCVVVSGDSMEPYIKHGETVYVSETAAIEPLDVGVWVIDGATYIKQYYPLDDGGMMLLSANPEREAANIHIHPDGNQSVQCFGKVLGIKKLPLPEYR